MLRGELDDETRARLLEVRSQRPQPARDDKAIASWNGLGLAALAEAGRRLDRDDLLAEARALGEFLLGPLSDEQGRLLRSRRAGRTSGAGFLDDYANVANGLYELHVATGELRWLEEARRLALLAVELFADEERGGFYLASAEGERLVARKKDLFDHPIPSGNSMLAYVLLRLARIYGDDELERHAVGVLRLFGESLGRAPTELAHALNALDLYLATPKEIAIVGPRRERGRAGRAGAVRPERGRRLRPGRGRAAARGQGARGRQARGLRLRTLRLRTPDHERGRHHPPDRNPNLSPSNRLLLDVVRRRRSETAASSSGSSGQVTDCNLEGPGRK